MCGVFGVIADKNLNKNAVNLVLNGCESLEYRGYDSVGIALWRDGGIEILKTLGSVSELRNNVPDNIWSHCSIGHTRWATHGRPLIENTHPLESSNLVLAHNGVLNNHLRIKQECQNSGYEFFGDTDTEVLLNFMQKSIDDHADLYQNLCSLEGDWSILWMDKKEDNYLYAFNHGRSLIAAYNSNNFLACIGSDMNSVSVLCDKYFELDNLMLVRLSSCGIELYKDGSWFFVDLLPLNIINHTNSLGDFESYMLKEINQQPSLILEQYRLYEDSVELIAKYLETIGQADQIIILACGSSYFAAMIGKYFLERSFKKLIHVELASEFRYRQAPINYNLKTLVIAVSQSGETADVLSCLNMLSGNNIVFAAICNVVNSALFRMVDLFLPLNAGQEVGVASTKAFCAQLFAFLYLSEKNKRKLCLSEVVSLSNLMKSQLEYTDYVNELAVHLVQYKSVFFIGRDYMWPLASEAALKFKEITYIHAESYAGGELKHGPLALIDENLPTVALLNKEHKDKMLSNIHEIEARSGQVFSFSSENINIADWLEPLFFVIPLQLLSYQSAKILGNSIDKPRNLAKCVTVE